ncbi:ATP synthase F1 subcomplex gamma subunit [Natranaerovirga pectinivora]|uniref:ATP synthase gamma chain n=1 Tax=Natranaerovirga pectinivora TaxID=682400 RepID=A0A4R3MM76_9FIRM|nr:ATP synthase F1 subunit gamma [Natranaerovirga pectinivora]TCT13086.1 ATP synthase F1 subcomplex gamma subunit [Natranaerovirga pectinivora]
MASIRDIKRRKTSIQSTQQITKAMKLVATAKLQKAKVKAEETREYFNKMYETVTSILSQTGDIDHQYLASRNGDKKGYIVITSNRGLAGGYNANIIKQVLNNGVSKENIAVYSAGKKGKDGLRRRGYSIEQDFSEMVEGPTYNDAVSIGKVVLEDYLNNKIDEIYLVYTGFVSTISQEAKTIKLLPIESSNQDTNKSVALMNYEPSEEDVLDVMIPRYVYSLIYGGLVESVASEQGARMTAMDSATSNANDMIEDLSLEYNRARQASITQEISEIVGGAEALK